jgi:hypothetical protein
VSGVVALVTGAAAWVTVCVTGAAAWVTPCRPAADARAAKMKSSATTHVDATDTRLAIRAGGRMREGC